MTSRGSMKIALRSNGSLQGFAGITPRTLILGCNYMYLVRETSTDHAADNGYAAGIHVSKRIKFTTTAIENTEWKE